MNEEQHDEMKLGFIVRGAERRGKKTHFTEECWNELIKNSKCTEIYKGFYGEVNTIFYWPIMSAIAKNNGFLHEIFAWNKNVKDTWRPRQKNEIFVKYWSLYLHNTDCETVRLNATENPLF